MFKSIKNKFKQSIFTAIIQFLPGKKSESNSNDLGVVTLCSHTDLPLFIYSIQSLFYWSNEILPLCVIDDGSLTLADKYLLSKKFTVTIFDPVSCDKKMKNILKKYPSFSKFRFSDSTPVLKRKFDALLLNPFKRFLFLDTDILFFKNPVEIMDWLHSKSRHSIYSTYRWKESEGDLELEIIFRNLLKEIFPSQNHCDLFLSSGMMGFSDKDFIDFPFLERVFTFFFKVGYQNYWLVEQHAMALLFSRLPWKLLPTEKYLNLWLWNQYHSQAQTDVVTLHYAGETKVKFQKVAIKLALTTHFFRMIENNYD